MLVVYTWRKACYMGNRNFAEQSVQKLYRTSL